MLIQSNSTTLYRMFSIHLKLESNKNAPIPSLIGNIMQIEVTLLDITLHAMSA